MAPTTEGHKTITSKYNYNQHVFPIFRDRCGHCHFAGGPTPMSLMTWSDAIPWAESIREQLIGEEMPPWFIDPVGPAARASHQLTSKELDMVITWCAGGTPQSTEVMFTGGSTPAGDASAPPEFAPEVGRWRLGEPDLSIRMDAEATLRADSAEEVREFTLSTALKDEKWVKFADLVPGTPSMVRDAVIAIENGPVLAAWVAGDDAVPAPSGAAFRLPAEAKLRLEIHYKKPWQDAGKVKTDRSTIGLYFSDPPLSGRAIEGISVADQDATANSTGQRTVSHALKRAARVVAIRPNFDRPYSSAMVLGVTATGRRQELLRFRGPQPGWYRRYWLVDPIDLPEGSEIQVVAVPAPGQDSVPPQHPLRVDVDVVFQ
jgi:hypothetical protein